MYTPFSQKILDWYAQHARELPWRGHPDPYAVWVSEIMLQQTRVETVIPYFQKWMQRFPSVFELATAPQQEVLNFWEGLGYYARARNLQRAAQIIATEYQGLLPRTAQALQQLPGIGRYSAAAIASIAFGEDQAALDGNIRRVLARVFDVAEPARKSSYTAFSPDSRSVAAYDTVEIDAIQEIAMETNNFDMFICDLTKDCMWYQQPEYPNWK